LEALGPPASEKSVGALLEVDPFLAHAVRQPVMLIETNPGREREVRAHANEDPAPALVVDIKVVLHDPAVCDLKMPAVELLVADRRHNTCRFSGFQDDDDLIGLCSLEVRVDEFVAPPLWRLDNRGVPFAGILRHPALKLLGSAAQDITADRIEVPVGSEKADDPFGLLKWLDEPVQQNPVKAPIAKANAVPVMLVEGVHGRPSLIQGR